MTKPGESSNSLQTIMLYKLNYTLAILLFSILLHSFNSLSFDTQSTRHLFTFITYIQLSQHFFKFVILKFIECSCIYSQCTINKGTDSFPITRSDSILTVKVWFLAFHILNKDTLFFSYSRLYSAPWSIQCNPTTASFVMRLTCVMVRRSSGSLPPGLFVNTRWKLI